ncbi:MAG: hypothetical protein F2518_09830 [Actinobacteria bacterium]|nr:hypothetical protein [Actinomycetota bacterium]
MSSQWGKELRVHAARRALMLSCLSAGLCLSMLVSGCVPEKRGASAEVNDGSDSAREVSQAPEFPDEGEVPSALLIEGLVYDMTSRPADQVYWTPPSSQARCAAERIVKKIGPSRLSVLGYRAGTPGAALNDIELTDAERTIVVDAFTSCVDLVQGIAAVFFGDGRISTRSATCMAKGLADQDLLRPFVQAWAFGGATDPLAENGTLATALLAQADVCIAPTALNWPDVRLPGTDPLIDSDAPGGSSSSASAADRPVEASTTSAPAQVTPTTAAG